MPQAGVELVGDLQRRAPHGMSAYLRVTAGAAASLLEGPPISRATGTAAPVATSPTANAAVYPEVTSNTAASWPPTAPPRVRATLLTPAAAPVSSSATVMTITVA